MSKRLIVCIVALIVWLVSIGAERRERIPYDNSIDFEANGFTIINTTAYIVGHHTYDGSAVYSGGCACSIDHIGDTAILYTTSGHFLGYYICNDTGIEGGGVRAGKVLDIYRCNMTHAKGWMKLTGGKVYVKWIEGDG